MERYWVNNRTHTNPHNDHEVHKFGCHKMPSDKKDLGYHPNCESALRKAREYYSRVDGCVYCVPTCHKQ